MGFHPPTIVRYKSTQNKLIWYLGEQEDEPWEGYDNVLKLFGLGKGASWQLRKPLYDARFLYFTAADPDNYGEETAVDGARFTVKVGDNNRVVEIKPDDGWTVDGDKTVIQSCDSGVCLNSGIALEFFEEAVSLEAHFPGHGWKDVPFVCMKPMDVAALWNAP